MATRTAMAMRWHRGRKPDGSKRGLRELFNSKNVMRQNKCVPSKPELWPHLPRQFVLAHFQANSFCSPASLCIKRFDEFSTRLTQGCCRIRVHTQLSSGPETLKSTTCIRMDCLVEQEQQCRSCHRKQKLSFRGPYGPNLNSQCSPYGQWPKEKKLRLLLYVHKYVAIQTRQTSRAQGKTAGWISCTQLQHCSTLIC